MAAIRSPRAVALVAALGRLRAPARGTGGAAGAPAGHPLTRAKAIGADDLQSYGNAPARLAGTLLPFAFDDLQETSPPGGVPPYAEYFSSSGAYEEAFGTSIVLGAPILLLALFAGRRRVWLLAGAAFLLLASTGDASASSGCSLRRFRG